MLTYQNGSFCPTEQPAYSAYRDMSYGGMPAPPGCRAAASGARGLCMHGPGCASTATRLRLPAPCLRAGYGTLTLLNATHAEWGYQRVYDPAGGPADLVSIRRNPACPYGALLPASAPAPAPAEGAPAASAAAGPMAQLAQYAAALLAAAVVTLLMA